MESRGASALTLVQDFFGEGGILSKLIPGYVPRPEQMKLAEAYTMSLLRISANVPETFVAEAPCGTGKTMAYLIPALMQIRTNRDRIVHQITISTGGISLQEQLYQKDIPLALKAVEYARGKLPSLVMTFKGRNNYLCPRKVRGEVDTAQERDALLYRDPELASWVTYACNAFTHGEWAHRDTVADVASAPRVLTPEEQGLLTSTADECSGKTCRFYNVCPSFQREEFFHNSQARGVVRLAVVNHHYFAMRKEIGVGLAIVDEAHELPDIVREASSATLTQASWRKHLSQIRKEIAQSPVIDPAQVEQGLQRCEEFDLSGYVRHHYLKDAKPGPGTPSVATPERMGQLSTVLLSMIPRGLMQLDATEKLVDVLYKLDSEKHALVVSEELNKPPRVSMILKTPVLNRGQAFFSATLRVKGSYDHFLKPLSRKNVRTFTASSPFDWNRQVLVVLDQRYQIDPKATTHARSKDAALEIVTRSKGRAMFALTSWSAVREVASYLKQHAPYRVLVQGEATKKDLVQAFQEDRHSILVGTMGLWTGVDVPGESLSCLVIDKIPFPNQSDPWMAWCSRNRKDWFMAEMIPRTAVLLAQGFGRLIRSVHDRGVCVVLDPRLDPRSKGASYGPLLFYNTFPEECQFSETIDEIPKFLP